MKRLILALIFALSIACGDDPETELTIASTPLAGTFGGQAWTFADGRADPGFEAGEVSIELHAVEVGACSGGQAESTRFLLFFTMAQPGTYTFGLQQNATFVTEQSDGVPLNEIALRGSLRIDEVTEAMIKGGIVAEADANSRVSGTFEVPRCMR